MDRLDSNTAESESATTTVVHLRQSLAMRLICTAVAVACPIAVILGAVMSGVPLPHGVIAAGLLEVFIIPYTILVYRFEVRVDQDAIVHREIVTRRIPLERIERIRVAHEAQPALGWLVKRTKIEILGDGARIMVAWRRRSMAPLLRFLEERFPHKIEDADSLPDV